MAKRSDITLKDQLAKRQNWKDALVDAVVATFCYRETFCPWKNVLDRYEWLVTKRVKGAERGQFQAHHGGFLKVTDIDIWDGVWREVREETGFVPDPTDLTFLTSVGPAIYRSELTLDADDRIRLQISGEEAEPTVAFAVPLFLCNMTGVTASAETDGEVKDQRWMTARQVVMEYGSREVDSSYSSFNYFQMFVPALLFLARKWTPGSRMVSQPGMYEYKV